MPDFFPQEDYAWVNSRVPFWKKIVKRGMDIILSLAAIVILFPVFLIIAAAIKLDSRGPVFFLQERGGYLGKPFVLWKFRTMIQGAEKGGYDILEEDPRITRVGKFLREWTLDELPQFWNVLKGEMSLVGPRPTLQYQMKSYTSLQKRRLLVTPGMTGLAQIRGRNALTWPERIDLDIRYIEEFSLRSDLKILRQTIGLVLSRRGIYRDSRL